MQPHPSVIHEFPPHAILFCIPLARARGFKERKEKKQRAKKCHRDSHSSPPPNPQNETTHRTSCFYWNRPTCMTPACLLFHHDQKPHPPNTNRAHLTTSWQVQPVNQHLPPSSCLTLGIRPGRTRPVSPSGSHRTHAPACRPSSDSHQTHARRQRPTQFLSQRYSLCNIFFLDFQPTNLSLPTFSSAYHTCFQVIPWHNPPSH